MFFPGTVICQFLLWERSIALRLSTWNLMAELPRDLPSWRKSMTSVSNNNSDTPFYEQPFMISHYLHYFHPAAVSTPSYRCSLTDPLEAAQTHEEEEAGCSPWHRGTETLQCSGTASFRILQNTPYSDSELHPASLRIESSAFNIQPRSEVKMGN